MKYLIDSADTAAIRRLNGLIPIEGVTTNPSIVAKTKREPYSVFREIKDIIQEKPLFVETLGRTGDEIVEEAGRITTRLGKDTVIKIPVSPEGLSAIKRLAQDGYITCATAVFTLSQALLAGRAGARYVAPYVNRISDKGNDGVAVTASIGEAFRKYGIECTVVGASFKNVRQVEDLSRLGVDSVTLPVDIFDKIINVEGTEEAIVKFEKDWETLGFGKSL